MEYIVIPRISAQRANALSTPWAVTMAPVFAATMFAHALGRAVGIQPISVGIIHHDAQLLSEGMEKGGYGSSPQQFRASTYIDSSDYSSGNKNALSLQPTVSMHLEISLILLFEEMPSLSEINKSLRSQRLAGGIIIDHQEVYSKSSLDDLFKSIHGGFFVLDKSHEIIEKSNGKNRIESLISLVNDKPIDGDKKRWLSPAVLGYAALTDFEKRSMVRDDEYHAFVEPLVGLVEYKGLSELKNLSLREKKEFPCFWGGKWLSDDVFVTQCDSLSNISRI